jgi:N6-adenosine-specific RNA methylase IME4
MFSVLCADPPWRFGDKLPGKNRGAERNYPTMTAGELCDLAGVESPIAVPPLASDSILFLWRVAAMQQEALDVVRAWGFTVKTEIVWHKLTKNGLSWFGMGRTLRASHETCLVATRGRPQLTSRSIRSVFSAPVPVDETGRYIHSAKPESFYTGIVEKLAPGPYAEMFSRRTRAGWTMLGNQVGKLDVAEAA